MRCRPCNGSDVLMHCGGDSGGGGNGGDGFHGGGGVDGRSRCCHDHR